MLDDQTDPASDGRAIAADPMALLEAYEQMANSKNLAVDIDDETLTEIGRDVISHYGIDKASMADWETRMTRALDLAMLVKKEKTTPWPNASNVIFPLVTSAALQYNARAYPAICPATDVCKVQVHGADQTGQKASRAGRVSAYQTYQLTTESREWERCTDQMTLQLPILGDVFRKMWWDPSVSRMRSQIRLPGRQVVVNNNADSIGAAPRISDLMELYPYQIDSRIRAGLFIDPEDPNDDEDNQAPVEFIEQHTRVDLDGDGYPEPYIITVHRDLEKVVRIVTGFDPDDVRIDEQAGEVVSIAATPYFIHYQFMPSMDGGLMGTGLGLLLGDISDTINTSINMMMDSAKKGTLGGGFIAGRDFRLNGGTQTLRPGEWQQLNFYGDDIRKGMVPLDHPGPSPVLFQLLGLMIDAGREIASVQDVMTGDAGRQNMPVGTVMALIEQGQMVFAASYKRIYRALKTEFALLARINQRNLDPEKYARFFDEGPGEADAAAMQAPDMQPGMAPPGMPMPQGMPPAGPQGQPPMPPQGMPQGMAMPQRPRLDPSKDFDLSDMDITPVADPNSVTSMQTMMRAQFVMEMAEKGMVDRQEAIRRVLGAARIEDIEGLMPKPDPAQQAIVAAQQEMLIADLRIKDAELENLIAKTQSEMAKAAKDMAAAEAETITAPLRAKTEELRAMKEVLNAQREAIVASRPGGMAGKPGN